MARVSFEKGKINIKSNDNKSADKLKKELAYEKKKEKK
jgi:hypothetical protein